MTKAVKSLPAGCRALLGSDYQSEREKLIQQILQSVAGHWEISRKQLLGHGKSLRFSWPRQVAIYLICKTTDLCRSDIAKLFRCHHSNVTFAVNKVVDYKSLYPVISEEIESLYGRINKKVAETLDKTQNRAMFYIT